MFILIFLLFSLKISAKEEADAWSMRWSTVLKITDQHTGYENGEMMQKPPQTWQLLLGVIRSDQAPLKFTKDCLWIKIPSKVDGELKLVSIPLWDKCEKSWDLPAIIHLKYLRSIQQNLSFRDYTLWITEQDRKVRLWKTHFLNLPEKRSPKMFDSATPQRSHHGVFFFAPDQNITTQQQQKFNELRGDLSDEYPKQSCSLVDGYCDFCRWGIYRVYDGNQEKYFCGIERCGEKNQPACFLGKEWVKNKNILYSCRLNNSLVICGPGLKVECVGELAVCR